MKVLTVCGSGKFKSFIHDFCNGLEKRGFIVLRPPLHNIGKYNLDEEGTLLLWKGATHAHLNRIKTADVCIMLNPNGYLGVGSSIELGYAASLGKLIIALEEDDEKAREVLFDIILKTSDLEEALQRTTEILEKF